MSEPMLLLANSERSLSCLLKREFSERGFRVFTADSAANALGMLDRYRPDLLIANLSSPDMSGYDLLERLRDYGNVPVILLAPRPTSAEMVRGLNAGADDYLATPINLDELEARVRAVLRRHFGPAAERVIYTGDTKIDLGRRCVIRDGEYLPLTRTEWNLLAALAGNAEHVMLNSELLARVWGPEYIGDLQYLRVWISRLRHKVEPDPRNPRLIHTFPGIGYMFRVRNEPTPVESGELLRAA